MEQVDVKSRCSPVQALLAFAADPNAGTSFLWCVWGGFWRWLDLLGVVGRVAGRVAGESGGTMGGPWVSEPNLNTFAGDSEGLTPLHHHLIHVARGPRLSEPDPTAGLSGL